ncbi:hypothetical protein TREES_T100011671 [Tupaia chinensis]|uniref:Uncharacterized protein n=1 Tax=Tupaia chinensis TaxID=246437 RepID=L9L2C7_TUPCH|nr:hypothetical protein TREES_T100011671 [Tupaia chinensis]
MCRTRCLCLCRVRTVEPLAQSMTPMHTASRDVNNENKFAPKITQEMCQSKSCQRFRDSFGESDKAVGYSQVLEDPICGPKPAFRAVKVEIVAKKREIPQNSNSSLQ